jgi:hypothetical protein
MDGKIRIIEEVPNGKEEAIYVATGYGIGVDTVSASFYGCLRRSYDLQKENL